MRVIAGKARRLPLVSPEGRGTRPTTDRIKETLFNILQDDIPGCRFLDLFSGSGAIGIEAISRGAKEAVFGEFGKEALSCIRANLKKTKLESQAVVFPVAVMRFPNWQDSRKRLILFMPTLPMREGLSQRF